ncbi:MAG: transporter substrate-binding domain-containing protein [Actinomycetota bacterium]|nr:transporter substrate-binding domain-containing protein [Actinomycetota bacterium]
MTQIRNRRLLRHRAAAVVVVVSALAVCLAACSGGASSDGADTERIDPDAETVDQALYDGLPDAIRDAGVVKVGGSFESLPLLNADPSDGSRPVGVGPELTALMEPIMGVDIEWENTAWPGQLPGLAAGSLDALMGQISVTADREREVADLVPFFLAATGIAYAGGNPDDFTQDLASLCGRRVATVSGSLYVGLLEGASEKYCESAGEDPIAISEYSTASAGAAALLSGQIDGYLEGAQSVRGIAAKSEGGMEWVELSHEQTKEWDPGLYGIAVDKSNPGLSAAFLGALRAIVEDGSYAKVLSKHDAGGALTLDQIKGNPLTGTPFGAKAD